MMRRRRGLALAWCLALAVHAGARAAPACSVTTPNIDFGNYDTLTPVDLVGQNITLACGGRGRATARITLSVGSGTYAVRTMSGQVLFDTLYYNLYADAAHTQVLGDGTSGTATFGPIQIKGATPPAVAYFTIYADLPGAQNVQADLYQSQPIIVTVSY